MSYSIINVVKDLVTGRLKFATRELATNRRTTCDQCEVQNKATKVCTACGCYIPWKTKLQQSSCPMELW
jgi:hypothetical protein